MSQPTPYTPSTDFSQQEAINASGRSTVNTSALDAELANIETTLDQTLANLELLQRDDGRLKDLACELHTLSPEVLNLIGGFNLRGLWQADTLYSVKDIVSNTEYTYFCHTQHTSGVAFDGQYWTRFGFSGGADAAQAAAAAQVSANNASVSAGAASASATSANGAASAAAISSGNAAGSASTSAAKAGESASSASNASNSAAAAQAAAESLPNAPAAGSDKFLKSSSDGLTWEYLTAEQARASLGIATGTSFKNILINSSFQINRRNYVSGATLLAGAYGHDRWKAGTSGGDYTFTQQKSATQITIASGKSIIQVVEDANVEGGTYVLAWTGTAKARIGLNSATPSGAYAVSPILITGQLAGVTTSVEFTNDGSGGTLLLPQEELGSIPSRKEIRPIGFELALCQRYLPAWQSTSTSDFIGVGQTTGTATAWIQLPIMVIPRVKPTGILVADPLLCSVFSATGTTLTCSAVTFIGASLTSLTVGTTSAAALAAGNAVTMYFNNASGKIFGLGCEL